MTTSKNQPNTFQQHQRIQLTSELSKKDLDKNRKLAIQRLIQDKKIIDRI